MFCPQCGKEYETRVNFCCHCGAALFAPSISRKTLYRSRTNKRIAGVCGGFAHYLDLDPSLVRILWVLLVIFAGCGILAYIIAWIIMPEEPLGKPTPSAVPDVSPQAASTR